MALIKIAKDKLIKALFGSSSVPSGLFELDKYFRHHKVINFRFMKEDGTTVAISTDFLYGSIIAQGKNEKELDDNIKDAILTSFDVPSSYAEEAKIVKQGTEKKVYALA